MIRVYRIGNKNCPFVVCDVCHQKIADYDLGLAAWNETSDKVVHLHKGACDDKEQWPFSLDLAEHLHDLCFNTGLDAEEMAVIAERYSE